MPVRDPASGSDALQRIRCAKCGCRRDFGTVRTSASRHPVRAEQRDEVIERRVECPTVKIVTTAAAGSSLPVGSAARHAAHVWPE